MERKEEMMLDTIHAIIPLKKNKKIPYLYEHEDGPSKLQRLLKINVRRQSKAGHCIIAIAVVDFKSDSHSNAISPFCSGVLSPFPLCLLLH
jgi:hypothetical protein